MKYEFVFLVLFLGSLSLALPLSSPSENIRLFPNTQKEVLINISQPNLEIKSLDGKFFSMNISYVVGNDRNQILSSDDTLREELNNMDPGFYQISLRSDEVTDILIDPKGIYFESIILISFLAIVNLIYQVRKYI